MAVVRKMSGNETVTAHFLQTLWSTKSDCEIRCASKFDKGRPSNDLRSYTCIEYLKLFAIYSKVGTSLFLTKISVCPEGSDETKVSFEE